MVSLKTIREDGKWYVVSSIYKPARAGHIGSGIIWATPYHTREKARIAMRKIKQRMKGGK